jgi:hypothetical protein
MIAPENQPAGKCARPSTAAAGGTDDQGFGKAGERIAQ